MTRADVANLCMALWRFERVRLGWENLYPKNVTMLFKFLPADQRAIFDQYLVDFKAAIDNLHLDPTEDRLKKIALRCNWENTSVTEMCTELTMLSEVTIDELKRHVFLHVPPQKQLFADKPDEFFEASWNAYPSAQKDMGSACRCYALGEDTASVFHSMGVVQKGLEALAKHMRVSFPAPLEAQQWQTIIDKLDAEIAQRTKMAAQQTKSSAKDEELKFYANTSLQFRYFKDAWRNDTAHFRESYNPDEAHTVLTHVKNFMVALSQKVRET
jgi:hypothetical protein